MNFFTKWLAEEEQIKRKKGTMQFKNQLKSSRLKEGFDSNELQSLLRGCALDMDWCCRNRWEKTLLVTSVLRGSTQQVSLCKAYQFKSGFKHCVGAAIDFSIRGLEIDQLNEIEKYIKLNWGQYCLLRVHAKGTGKHMHLELMDDLIDKVKLYRMISITKDAEEWFVR